jgi:hypothetical protein
MKRHEIECCGGDDDNDNDDNIDNDKVKWKNCYRA